jgi:small subunit ribosomal protein S4
VSHGHIFVNGKKVDRRSFYVRPGMVISVKPKSQNNPLIKNNVELTANEIPSYLTLDESKFSGTLIASPHTDQIPLPLPINVPLICEFLAHSS